MKHRIATIAAAVIACASTTAQAVDSSASVKVNNLTFTAFDLVPGDAQLPSYELLPDNGASYVSVERAIYGSWPTEKTASGLSSPVSLALNAGPNAAGSAWVTANGFEAKVTGSDVFKRVSATAAGSNNITNPRSLIRLAPGTGILVSGQYDIAMTSACPTGTVDCQASVELYARLWGTGWLSEYDGTYFYKSLSLSSGSQTFSGVAGTSYVNFTDEYVNLDLSFFGRASITSVPEPTMVGLMVAGLCTTVLTARRKRGHGDARAHRAVA